MREHIYKDGHVIAVIEATGKILTVCVFVRVCAWGCESERVYDETENNTEISQKAKNSSRLDIWLWHLDAKFWKLSLIWHVTDPATR